MGVTINLKILSGTNISGVNPYIVVCFDKIDNHVVYKTASIPGGRRCSWNESVSFDLESEMEKATKDGYPKPMYLSFCVYDAAADDLPSLGAATILISTILDKGYLDGDYPIIDGDGEIHLIFEVEQNREWANSSSAKTVGIVGAVGLGALVLGLTARHYHKKRQASKKKEGYGRFVRR